MSPETKARLMLPGAVFGELTLIRSYRQQCGPQKISMLEMVCSCGRQFSRKLQTFNKHKEQKIHMDCGACDFPNTHKAEYKTWISINHRCYCETSVDYPRYGGKGIKVCQRWRASFRSFLADMGKRPEGTYSIDRIDSSKDYSPENCRWADVYEQNQGRNYENYLTHPKTDPMRYFSK